MTVLDRYLQAVRFWLPKSGRQDIIQELADDIRTQVEEKEADLGRPLEEAELEAILARHGHPLVVAERYMPDRYLIGPLLFPLYLFLLKLFVGVCLVPWVLVWIFIAILVPGFRAAHPGMEAVRSVWLAAIHWFAWVTVAFALIERSDVKSRIVGHWSPRELPEVRDVNRIPRASSIAEIVFGVVFTLWWVDALRLPAADIRMLPALSRMYWPILVMSVVGIALAMVNLVWPWWTARRAAVRLAIDMAALVIAGLLLSSGGGWLGLTATDLSPEQLREITRWLNLPLQVTFILCAVGYAARAVQDWRRTVGKPPLRIWAIRFLTGE